MGCARVQCRTFSYVPVSFRHFRGNDWFAAALFEIHKSKTISPIHSSAIIKVWPNITCSFQSMYCLVSPAVKLGECCTWTGWHPGVFHLHFEIESFLQQPAEQESSLGTRDERSVPKTRRRVKRGHCLVFLQINLMLLIRMLHKFPYVRFSEGKGNKISGKLLSVYSGNHKCL